MIDIKTYYLVLYLVYNKGIRTFYLYKSFFFFLDF